MSSPKRMYLLPLKRKNNQSTTKQAGYKQMMSQGILSVKFK